MGGQQVCCHGNYNSWITATCENEILQYSIKKYIEVIGPRVIGAYNQYMDEVGFLW